MAVNYPGSEPLRIQINIFSKHELVKHVLFYSGFAKGRKNGVTKDYLIDLRMCILC